MLALIAPGVRRRLLRRSLCLVLLCTLTAAAALIARAMAPDDRDLAVALLGLPAALGGLLAAIWGLAHQSEWAAPAAVGILWLFVIEGVVATVRACASGPGLAIHVPVAAIAAALVLWTSPAPPGTPLAGGQRIRTAMVVGLMALGLAWPYVAGVLITRG